MASVFQSNVEFAPVVRPLLLYGSHTWPLREEYLKASVVLVEYDEKILYVTQ